MTILWHFYYSASRWEEIFSQNIFIGGKSEVVKQSHSKSLFSSPKYVNLHTLASIVAHEAHFSNCCQICSRNTSHRDRPHPHAWGQLLNKVLNRSIRLSPPCSAPPPPLPPQQDLPCQQVFHPGAPVCHHIIAAGALPPPTPRRSAKRKPKVKKVKRAQHIK